MSTGLAATIVFLTASGFSRATHAQGLPDSTQFSSLAQGTILTLTPPISFIPPVEDFRVESAAGFDTIYVQNGQTYVSRHAPGLDRTKRFCTIGLQGNLPHAENTLSRKLIVLKAIPHKAEPDDDEDTSYDEVDIYRDRQVLKITCERGDSDQPFTVGEVRAMFGKVNGKYRLDVLPPLADGIDALSHVPDESEHSHHDTRAYQYQGATKVTPIGSPDHEGGHADSADQ